MIQASMDVRKRMRFEKALDFGISTASGLVGLEPAAR